MGGGTAILCTRGRVTRCLFNGKNFATHQRPVLAEVCALLGVILVEKDRNIYSHHHHHHLCISHVPIAIEQKIWKSSITQHVRQQSPDWRSEEDDRQVATSPQLGSTNRLEYAQVRPGTHSFSAKSATLTGRSRPGSVQSLRPGVQMSAQDGS